MAVGISEGENYKDHLRGWTPQFHITKEFCTITLGQSGGYSRLEKPVYNYLSLSLNSIKLANSIFLYV